MLFNILHNVKHSIFYKLPKFVLLIMQANKMMTFFKGGKCIYGKVWDLQKKLQYSLKPNSSQTTKSNTGRAGSSRRP